jgi:hypothetical protein
VGSSAREKRADIIDRIFHGESGVWSGQQKQRVMHMRTQMNHDIRRVKHFERLLAMACAFKPRSCE